MHFFVQLHDRNLLNDQLLYLVEEDLGILLASVVFNLHA